MMLNKHTRDITARDKPLDKKRLIVRLHVETLSFPTIITLFQQEAQINLLRRNDRVKKSKGCVERFTVVITVAVT